VIESVAIEDIKFATGSKPDCEVTS
jgi:hypothetical protein